MRLKSFGTTARHSATGGNFIETLPPTVLAQEVFPSWTSPTRRRAGEQDVLSLRGFLADLLMAVQKAQRFPNNLTRSLIPAGLDAALKKGVEFRSDRHVYCGSVGRHA